MKESRLSRIFYMIVGGLSVVLGMAAVAYATNVMFHEGTYLSVRGDPGQLDAGYMPVVFVTGLALLLFGLIHLWLRR